MDNIITKIKLPKQSTASEPGETVVSVKNVSKKFCKKLKRSMAYGIIDLSKNLVGLKPDSNELRKDEFWAVDDVSFELRKGEVLGLIGLNGSGKTTLLRLLTGIFPPDKGEIMMKGRVGALIAVGAGFHPHMTGRENIYLNGTILGMSREEIDSKFQEIVDFAAIGDFLDAPVSTYSSGMRVRLGFAIAVNIKPDILLIDEVLAVGDASFRYKCINEIDRLMADTAVVYVSHNLPEVTRICSRILVIERGRAVFVGNNVTKGIEHFISSLQQMKATISENGKAKIHSVKVYTDKERDQSRVLEVDYLDDLYFKVEFSLIPEVKGAEMQISIGSRQMGAVAQVISNCCNFDIRNNNKRMTVRVKLPRIQFNAGIYYYTVKIINAANTELIYNYSWVGEFQVVGYPMHISPMQIAAEWTHVD